jgi:DNA-binding transcriptional LysR family regulator
LGLRLFHRHGGRFLPTPEATDIFERINDVYKSVDRLRDAISRIEEGDSHRVSLASVPSIGRYLAPRAIARLRRKYEKLEISYDILKIEEAIEAITLRRVDLVAISYRFDHPGIVFSPLVAGRLVCIAPPDHPMASKASISLSELAGATLIGVEPSDPYGNLMAEAFRKHGLDYRLSIRVRFGQSACALVANGAGLAVIDEFTVAGEAIEDLRVLPIRETTNFQTYAASKADAPLSVHAEDFVRFLRQEMRAAVKKGPSGQVASP